MFHRCVIIFAIGFVAAAAQAQVMNPPILKEVGIDQNLGAQVPGELTFRDETGKEVRLADYFRSGRPIVLTLVYYRCPMLCTMVLNDVTRTINVLPLAVGKDFDILTISFDPRETPELAAAKKKQYLHSYHRKGETSATGWHFLTGDQAAIETLTKTVGFRYSYDPKFDQYAHASGYMILTPDGKVTRYFYGIDTTVKDLRLSLVEASGGKVGSPVERVMLYCFHYDPATGKYSLAITRILKVAAGLTVAALGSYMLIMLWRERRALASASGAALTAGERIS